MKLAFMAGYKTRCPSCYFIGQSRHILYNIIKFLNIGRPTQSGLLPDNRSGAVNLDDTRTQTFRYGAFFDELCFINDKL